MFNCWNLTWFFCCFNHGVEFEFADCLNSSRYWHIAKYWLLVMIERWRITAPGKTTWKSFQSVSYKIIVFANSFSEIVFVKHFPIQQNLVVGNSRTNFNSYHCFTGSMLRWVELLVVNFSRRKFQWKSVLDKKFNE